MTSADARWRRLLAATQAARRDPHYNCAHRRYEMTCQEYDELAAAQGGACGVCRRTPAQALEVDHDHAAGLRAVRGLVCHLCNTSVLMKVDAGDVPAPEAVQRYFAAAWHLRSRN